MTIKKCYPTHRKICGNHAFTKASEKLAIMLCGLDEVRKVVGGRINTCKHGNGRRCIKVFSTETGLKLAVHADAAVQVIFVCTQDPDPIKKAVGNYSI